MTFTAQEAYIRAQTVDGIINTTLKEFSPDDPDNRHAWITFLRTIQTSLNVMYESTGLRDTTK